MSPTALAPARPASTEPASGARAVPTPRGPQQTGRPHPAAVVGLVAVVALTATLATARADEASADRAATVRAARASGTDEADAGWLAAQPGALAVVAAASQRAALTTSVQAADADARAVLAASPHAGDLLGALTAAADRVRDTAATSGQSPAVLRARLADLATARGAVVQAEAAWQAAEAARVAAEQEAAQAAAQQAAALRAPSVRRSSARPSTGSSAAPAPADVSAGTVHAVTMACVTPAPGSGSPASAASVGAAINDYRAANGLATLSVSTSGTLSSHALDMAASGGIWHSGSDNIVGCAPGAGLLVRAWSGSPAHNAQMLRTDVSSMSVGAASASGYLFAAVAFG